MTAPETGANEACLKFADQFGVYVCFFPIKPFSLFTQREGNAIKETVLIMRSDTFVSL